MDQTQAACGTCHGLPPPTGRHNSVWPQHSFMGKDCNYCHNGVANSTASGITSPALHINGVKDVKLKNNGTYNAATHSCTPSCHGTESWTGGGG